MRDRPSRRGIPRDDATAGDRGRRVGLGGDDGGAAPSGEGGSCPTPTRVGVEPNTCWGQDVKGGPRALTLDVVPPGCGRR